MGMLAPLGQASSEMRDHQATWTQCLQLPETTRIHKGFHVSLLRTHHAPTYPGHATQLPGAVLLARSDKQYKVAIVINSRENVHTGRIHYLVKWLGYEGTDEHTSWSYLALKASTKYTPFAD